MSDIVLRRAEISDAELIQAVYHYPGTQGGTLQLPFPSAELWRERLAKPDGNRHMLVALIDGVVVGTAGLHLEIPVRRRHVAGFGIGIADPWHGKGVGSKLTGALMDLADNWLNLLRVELTVFVDNPAAIALYRKFGFEEEGRLRAYALRDGRYVDVFTMARLHPNPPALPSRLPT